MLHQRQSPDANNGNYVAAIAEGSRKNHWPGVGLFHAPTVPPGARAGLVSTEGDARTQSSPAQLAAHACRSGLRFMGGAHRGAHGPIAHQAHR